MQKVAKMQEEFATAYKNSICQKELYQATNLLQDAKDTCTKL